MRDQPLKILIISQYFWPENMRINDLAEGLVARGHEVTVLTGTPNYPAGSLFPDYKNNPSSYLEYEGVQIIRVPMVLRGKHSITLALNYLSFFISASTIGAYKLRAREFDAIFVYAVSPILSAIPAIVVGRLKKVPVFVWVLDLWPETLSAVGVVKNPKILGVVGRVVSWIYNRTDYLLLQSQGFMGSVRKYCTKPISDDRLVYFPSWAEDDFSAGSAATSDLLSKNDSVFTVVFAGNIGESQDFPAVLDAVEALQSELPVRWVIVGDGRMSDWVKNQAQTRNLNNVLLLGRHPLEKMPALFATADALLVSLRTNEVFSRTIPGKLQSYLASARPIIAMIDGEAARVVEASGAGLVCSAGDANGLAEIVRQMAKMSVAQRDSMGFAGRAFYQENFAKQRIFDKLESLFGAATLRRGGRNA